MPSCCIRQCSARKNINQPELTLHRFPVNEIGKKKWLEMIGIENINPRHKTWYVCSMHFDESCFNRTLDVTRLRDGAIPSLFLQPNRSCHMQPSTSGVMVADKSSKPILLEIQNKSESTCAAEVKFPDANLDINASIARVADKSSEQVLLEKECSDPTHPPEVILNLTAPVAKIPQQNEKIKDLTNKCEILKKKVKSLNEKVRRRDKKIARFSDIIKDLQNRNFINNEEKMILEECAGPEDFLKRQIAKSKGLPLQKKYSEEMRKFIIVMFLSHWFNLRN